MGASAGWMSGRFIVGRKLGRGILRGMGIIRRYVRIPPFFFFFFFFFLGGSDGVCERDALDVVGDWEVESADDCLGDLALDDPCWRCDG